MSRSRYLAGALAASALLGLTVFGTADEATTPSVEVSKSEYEQIRERLRLKNQPWASVPWEVNLTAARRRAAAEGKPVFLVVNTGNCLGYV